MDRVTLPGSEAGYRPTPPPTHQCAFATAVRSALAFWRCDRGAISIEYLIWVPIFAVCLTLAVDLSITLYGYSKMWDVAREAGRRTATGEMTTVEALNYAQNTLGGLGTYQVTIDDTDDFEISVTIIGREMSPFYGAFDVFSIGDMQTIYRIRKEGVVGGA